MERQLCQCKKNVLISEIQINILMGLNIHGSAHDSVSVVIRHCNFSRKIDWTYFDNQIGVVQNFSRFNRIKKHFRMNFVVTNNISAYEKQYSHDRHFIEKYPIS